MILVKIRLPSQNLAVYELSGETLAKSLTAEHITRYGRHIATKFKTGWVEPPHWILPIANPAKYDLIPLYVTAGGL